MTTTRAVRNIRTTTKKSKGKSMLAAAALFLHVTTFSNEALSLTFKTYAGYKDQFSEGTWVNDLTDCIAHGRKMTLLRAHDDEPGIVRVLVNKVCPKPQPLLG